MTAALDAVDPRQAVLRHLQRSGEHLMAGDRSYDLARYRRIVVVGAGKAGAPMAQAVEQVLGDRLSAGIVNVKRGQTLPTHHIRLVEAGHPVPDAAGEAGAREIVRLAQSCGPEDLLLCLISGGGSALLSLPVEGVTLAEMATFTSQLLRSGATINELNTLRKHLEQAKGGLLAHAAQHGTVIALILSDVVGNPLDVIASGPTVADSSTFSDAWAILERYGLVASTPVSIAVHLRHGLSGTVPETPKKGDPAFARVQNLIVGSNDLAARAAESAARAAGLHPLILSTWVQGEAREVGTVLAAIAREIATTGRPVAAPACVIVGGETTVTVRGEGRGGRNQEMALAAALHLRGLANAAVVCLATDGTDGPTDASGAWADGSTLERAAALGLDARAHLQANNAYPFFAALGDLLLTGPTNTNVNDLAFVLAWP
ncbi:MAG: glycerate kinase [Chloroflexi bacterium]|nr:glycerate kinase [Chloroflexota bacterium]